MGIIRISILCVHVNKTRTGSQVMASQPLSPLQAVRALAAACLLLIATAAAVTSGAIAAEAPAVHAPTLREQLGQLQAQLRALAQENRALREHQELQDRQLAQLLDAASQTAAAAAPGRGTTAQGADRAATPAGAIAAPDTDASPMPVPAAAPVGTLPALTAVRLWGYGEMYYTHPTSEHRKAQADLARAVFGLGYSFDARTEFNSEYEVEHAVASAADVGEFEVEQFYVDRRMTDALGVRGGLFLMPFGLLNEHHEPTSFYGVQRNFVETLIIPSTWREGGLALHGDSASAVGWNVGLTTGFDLSKWSFAPQFPPYATALGLEYSHVAPLQAAHQELSLANARELSEYAALSYVGLPGVLLGAAISTGQAVPAAVPAPLQFHAGVGGGERVTLWEVHARWMPGRWDLSGLYAHGAISNTAPANAANPGSPNPIPASFYGYFLQGAYGLWQQADYRLVPFVRLERYNLGASYTGTAGAAIPTGLVPLSSTPGDLGHWPQNRDRVLTTGANFYLGPHLVVKGDYQWFEINRGLRRFDLGLGLSF